MIAALWQAMQLRYNSARVKRRILKYRKCYREGLASGHLTAHDIRRMEGLPPLPQQAVERAGEQLMDNETAPRMIERDGLVIRWVEAEMQAVSLMPGDTLVLMHPARLSETAIAGMRAIMQETFPGHRVLVLEEGKRLGVLRPEGEAEASKE